MIILLALYKIFIEKFCYKIGNFDHYGSEILCSRIEIACSESSLMSHCGSVNNVK